MNILMLLRVACTQYTEHLIKSTEQPVVCLYISLFLPLSLHLSVTNIRVERETLIGIHDHQYTGRLVADIVNMLASKL